MGKVIRMPERGPRRSSTQQTRRSSGDRRHTAAADRTAQRRTQPRNARRSAAEGRAQKKVVEVEKRVVYQGSYDYLILVLLAALLAFGLVMVYSSSYYVAEVNGESATQYFLKQLLCVGIGAVCMLIAMRFDYHNFVAFGYDAKRMENGFYKKRPLWQKPYFWIFLVAAATLALVYTPIGVELNGSRRWINVGISIQPSEITKIGVIVMMAASIGEDPRKMRKGTAVIPYLLILGALGSIFLTQPNFSALMCVTGLVMFLLIIGGTPMKTIWTLIGSVVVLGVIFLAIAPYRMKRVIDLFNPENSWQLKQSLYSIGAGGLFGRGLGNSMQKLLYLPYRESDFIFAIIAEETGLFGCLMLLTLFALLIWRGVVTAMHAPDLTGMLIASGCTAALAIQVGVNVMVNIGLLPPTGVVLPFISYGGSGVVIFMTMVGMILNVSKQAPPGIPAKQSRFPLFVEKPKEDPAAVRGLKDRRRRKSRYDIEQRQATQRRKNRRR